MKLGVIGLGSRMTHMLNNAIRPHANDLRVVGLIEPDEKRAREALSEEEKRMATFHKTLDSLMSRSKPDAIVIGTRCDLHARYACEAAATGLPIFLEKPVAITMSQALELASAFEKSASEVVVSFPLRASAMFGEVLDLTRSAEFGRPEHILGVNYVPYGNVYFDSWYRDYRTTQGLFLQKATHDFDYLAELAGAPIVRVASMISQGRVFRDRAAQATDSPAEAEGVAYFEGVGTPETGMNEDSSSALLEFGNGVKGVYTQVFFIKRDAAARGATLSNYKGTVTFDWYQNTIRHVPHFEGETKQWSVAETGGHFGGDAVLGRNFVEVVRGEAESISTIGAGLSSVFACLAAKESAETGQFINVHQCAMSLPKEIAVHG